MGAGWRRDEFRRSSDGFSGGSFPVCGGGGLGGPAASLAGGGTAGGGEMIAGHFGFAAMLKARERSAPLWALMLATVWLDVVFVPLFLAHWETVEPVSTQAGYGGLVIHADYTHSIVGVLILSVLLGAMFLPRLGRRVALVIGLVSASHWVLDLVVHRADMPVLPGNFGGWPRLGLGLWERPVIAAVLELGLVGVGAVLYWRAAEGVSAGAGKGGRLAKISAGLVGVFGVFVLALDFWG